MMSNLPEESFLPSDLATGPVAAPDRDKDDVENTRCRLCGGSAQLAFRQQLLGHYQVSYFLCSICRSLETESPYWLSEAYANDTGDGETNLADLDTGAAQRSVGNAAAISVVARVFGARNINDIGGGDGLFARLLRDAGFNAFVSDLYARATYARGFTKPDFEEADLVTAFEVLEHFPDPANDLTQLFSWNPRVVIVTTERYSDQSAGWWYLLPETGQHIFFYSEAAMQLIATRFGYGLLQAGIYTLFVKPELFGWRTRLLKQMLRAKPLKLARALFAMGEKPGIAADFVRLQGRSS